MSERAAAASLQRLTSGRRIVSAADDAAGLSISERMRGQASGLLMAQRNVQDAIGFVQTADGALEQMQSMLQRARELAVRYAHGTMSAADRTALQVEADALGQEAERLLAGSTFNRMQILAGGALGVQAGGSDGDWLSITLPDLNELLDQDPFYISGEAQTITVTTLTTSTSTTTSGTSNGNGAERSGGRGRGGSTASTTTTTTTSTTTTTTVPMSPPIGRLDGAIEAITAFRGELGAFQNRLEHARSSLASAHEQTVASESRIRDADIAAEVVALTRNRIKGDVTGAMTAQAQVQARNVLKLLAA